MAEFKVEARKHPVITGALVGAIVGYLYARFWWFRLIILCTVAYFCLSYTYDWMFTERTLPASTNAIVFNADVVKPIDTSFSDSNLDTKVHFSVENIYSETIDHLTILTNLYDCPTTASPLSQCQLLKTKAFMPGIDLAPGKTWQTDRTVTFDNAPALTNYSRVTFSYRNVVVDSDNKGREPRQ